MIHVINHRPANGKTCRGLWSSLPPREDILSLSSLLCGHAAWRVRCSEGQTSPSLETSIVLRIDILVRLFLVTRTRDPLIYLEKKGEFVYESTPGQGGKGKVTGTEVACRTDFSLSLSWAQSLCLFLS